MSSRNTAQPQKKLARSDFPAARSLFRSLFMEGWDSPYPTWQEAIIVGALDWAFTADKLKAIVRELDALYSYPEADVTSWLTKACGGLPNGSPDPTLTTRAFIVQVRIVVSSMAGEWEEKEKPRRVGR